MNKMQIGYHTRDIWWYIWSLGGDGLTKKQQKIDVKIPLV